ncbi:hypothetical protein GRF29_154g277502 [Pseudopithomyces chartarum]|uniref:Glutamyl-tRNA synthetase n=1 Tax=Pseudopithomyces chartarum TaxID=1892770 RepID=A0AAN6LT73_9PLEO|nr:hypothetical protein GRF29_154g277502 [Pseudopithomyces chartarum]
MTTPFDRALSAIDAAHALDPNTKIIGATSLPYELHYAQKCTSYLHQLSPSPSPALSLAIRAQHFRRWEIPRSSYPMTRPGYHAWRTYLKNRQADLVREILDDVYAGHFPTASEHTAFVERVSALMRKEGLREGDEEVAVLEDVACLVFLEDQFEGWVAMWEGGTREDGGEGVRLEEEKVVGILRRTWGKMSEKGREVARGLVVQGRAGEVLGRALAGE